MAVRLSQTEHYRVLKKLPMLQASRQTPKHNEKIAIILDTETTGLNHRTDEIIEFAAIAITYDELSRVTSIIDTFSQIRQPALPLPPHITAITGLTDEYLSGKHLNLEQLEKFVKDANLIIAHNAGFDRPFCEALSESFERKAWACSLKEIHWRELGYDGANLGYLLMQAGFFYAGHRALNDCYALLQILVNKVQDSDQTAFQKLIDSARSKRVMIEINAPFEFREVLRSRGYGWNPAYKNKTGFWSILISDEASKGEVQSLSSQLNLRDTSINLRPVSAFELYKAPML